MAHSVTIEQAEELPRFERMSRREHSRKFPGVNAGTRERSCTSKRRYRTEESAKKYAQRYKSRIYSCGLCRGFHLTTKAIYGSEESNMAETASTPTLHAFYDGDTTVIAESAREAMQILLSTAGIPFDEQTPEEEWERLPLDRVFTITDDNGKPPEKKTVAEWIQSNGKGYLCSENF